MHVFSFAPVVGVEYFRVFFGRERCVLCFCAKKKRMWTPALLCTVVGLSSKTNI